MDSMTYWNLPDFLSICLSTLLNLFKPRFYKGDFVVFKDDEFGRGFTVSCVKKVPFERVYRAGHVQWINLNGGAADISANLLKKI
jgi:hypothetical protein